LGSQVKGINIKSDSRTHKQSLLLIKPAAVTLEKNLEIAISKMHKASFHEVNNAYSLFVYAVTSQITRDYYLRRLRIFFNYINLHPDDGTMEERCIKLTAKETKEPNWAFSCIVRFLQFQRERVEKEMHRPLIIFYFLLQESP
jgi:hypothetical protein